MTINVTCGCIDNNKLNNNKNLNKDKLSLDSMKYLSIDEIISLYRQGYVLEGLESVTIEALTIAYPNIIDATGYWSTALNEGYVIALFSNSGTCGWIKHVAGDDIYGSTFGEKQQCFPAKVGLLYKAFYYMTIPVNIAFVKMYACNTTSSDTCNQAGCVPGATAACTDPSASPVASRYSIGIGQFTSLTPNPPTNLQVTPGDGQLTFSWTPPIFTDPITGQGIFDYYLEVYDALGNGYDGHILGSAASYIFDNLTNGTQYTCTIKAISRCDMQSTAATITGTPSGPITGTIHFSITTSDGGPKDGFEIYLDGSPTSSGTTDINGIFDVTVSASPSPGTSHTYRIHKTNYTDQTGSVSVVSGQISNVYEIMQSTIVLTSISPASATIQVNTTQQFTAKDQNTNTITTGVTWVKTIGVGSIDVAGLYSAGSTAGTATISATYGGITKTAPITVTAAPPTIVLTSISPASATIQVNTTQQFTAKDQNTNTITTGVTWAKTTGVGSIDTVGLYSAGPTAGTATISATYGGVTKTAPITVTGPCIVISLVASPTSVQQGQSTTLTATVTNPPNTAGYNVDFKVDGYLVATRATNSSGVATYSLNTSSLTVATHNITASIGSPAQCTSSTVTIDVTAPVQAGAGGAMMIAAVAAIGIAYFMMKKPPTKMK